MRVKIPRKIKFLRKKIDKNFEAIVKLIAERRKIVLEIDKIKKEKKILSIERKREKEIIKNSKELAKKYNLPKNLIERIVRILIQDGRKLQEK